MAEKFIHKPRVACEIGTSRLTAARATAARDGIELYAAQKTPAKTVHPSVLVGNIEDPAALVSKLQAILEPVASKNRDVIVVVPDAAVRVNILDFDQLPSDDEEARAVVRLRFRRNVPFEAEDASVSFQRLPSRSGSELRVLAVAMPRIGLEGYEKVVRDAGFYPGVVVPATLAAMGTIDTSAPCMVVRHSPATDGGTHTTTMVIASGDDVLLYRTIESSGVASPESVLDDVHSSLVFYEDNYGSRLTTVYLDGIPMDQTNTEAMREHTGAALKAFPQSTTGQNLSDEALTGGVLAPLEGALLS